MCNSYCLWTDCLLRIPIQMAWREARNSPSESRQYPLPADYKVMLPGYYGRREGRTCFNILTLDNQPPLCFSAYLVGVDVE